MKYFKIALLTFLLSLSACQAAEKVPAVLASIDAQDIELVQAEVGNFLNNSRVLISEDAFSDNSELIIERARSSNPDLNTGREFERPMHFRLWKQGQNCLLEYVENGELIVIPNLHCSAI